PPRRRRRGARLRASPRRGPPRHQARECAVPGRPGGGGGLRDRTRRLRRRGLAAHRNRAVARHAAVYEPGAGHGRPAHRRAQRHLLARHGPVRDARRRAAPGARPVARFTLALPPGAPLAEFSAGPTVALSPDGSRIVYVSSTTTGNQLFSRKLEELEPVALAGTQKARGPFFSPDGRWV